MSFKSAFCAVSGMALLSACSVFDSTMSAGEWREAAMEPHHNDYTRETDREPTFHNCVAVQGDEYSYLLKSWEESTLLVERDDTEYDGYCLEGLDIAEYSNAIETVRRILTQIKTSDISETSSDIDLNAIHIPDSHATHEAAAVMESSRQIYNFIQENDIDNISDGAGDNLVAASSVFWEQTEQNENIARLEAYRTDGTLDRVVARYEQMRPYAEHEERCAAENDLSAAVDIEKLPAVIFSYWTGDGCLGNPSDSTYYKRKSRVMITPGFSM